VGDGDRDLGRAGVERDAGDLEVAVDVDRGRERRRVLAEVGAPAAQPGEGVRREPDEREVAGRAGARSRVRHGERLDPPAEVRVPIEGRDRRRQRQA
jgi:hypothetical protein